jgi:hypothetical protein
LSKADVAASTAEARPDNFRRAILALVTIAGFGPAIAQPVTTAPNISNLLTQCLPNTPLVGTGAGSTAICHASGALRTAAFFTPGTGVSTALAARLNASSVGGAH